MKKLLWLWAVMATIHSGFAQNDTSNMKLIYNSDGSISPPYYLPLASANSKILELSDESVQMFNILLNPLGAYNPFQHFYVTKFRFVGPSDLGIDSGLVIASGSIISDPPYFGDDEMGIAWPAVYNSAGYNPGQEYFSYDPSPRYTQYPDLVALNDGDSIIDAVIVEFDFVPQGSTLNLDYVFASEEYPENLLKSPNDQVGIFLSRPGVPGYQNIARVPGTTVPVGI